MLPNCKWPWLTLTALSLCSPAASQHGVIREYAALAPSPDATPLRPLLDVPLTDISITAGHDRAYYMTAWSNGAGSAPSMAAASRSAPPRFSIWAIAIGSRSVGKAAVFAVFLASSFIHGLVLCETGRLGEPAQVSRPA